MTTLNIHTGLQCTMVATHQIPLTAHPSTQSAAIRSLSVQVSVPTPGLLTLRYVLRADMSRIRLGSEVTPAPAEGLWKHTCFEAFIQPAGSAGYYEFNFAPTREWAVYRFSGYRDGMTAMALANPPDIAVTRGADLVELAVTFPQPLSAAEGAAPRPRLAVTAVVEEDSGRLCYWSGRHPQGKPDFHHPDGFAFEL
jgi:hypothetical protein